MKVSALLVQRIREEFEELRGLRLSLREATDFWALDRETCKAILAELYASGFLYRDRDGRFFADYRVASAW
jgi:hypothetical protein